MSFPRSRRLLTARDYDSVFKRNKRVANRYWTVLGRAHNEGDARLGMAIAKKRARHAVTRNRIKRVCRESFRLNGEILSGIDVVVMNRDAAASASKQELRSSLDDLWVKLSRSARSSIRPSDELAVTSSAAAPEASPAKTSAQS